MPASDCARQLALRQRPSGTPVMFQSWRNLLFLHWRFEPEVVQRLLPAGLTVETFDGSAWVGVVPFFMRHIRPRWFPAVPYISNFLELNLRTYAVDREGVPGVWFISLNANRWLAVQIARRWFRLPYHWSSMSVSVDPAGWIDYRCRRFGTPRDRACRYRYRGEGEVGEAAPGTLEFFLVERYVLFARLPDGSITTGQVHHVPYPIREAGVSCYDEHLMVLDQLPPPSRPFDHACFSAGVDVEVFPLKRGSNGG